MSLQLYILNLQGSQSAKIGSALKQDFAPPNITLHFNILTVDEATKHEITLAQIPQAGIC
jgi:hypothetical protein